MIVMHTCDNPQCINPEHLEVGTQRDNMLDKVRKGRHNAATGERVANSKLKEADILKIREDNRKQREIAEEYGVTPAAISAIKLRRVWRHV